MALAVGIGAGGVWSGVVTRRIWVALAGVVAIVTLPTLHFLEGGAPHYYPFIVYDGSTSYYLGALIVTFVAAFISGFGILTPSAGRRIGL